MLRKILNHAIEIKFKIKKQLLLRLVQFGTDKKKRLNVRIYQHQEKDL